jgi:hypothetical protein
MFIAWKDKHFGDWRKSICKSFCVNCSEIFVLTFVNYLIIVRKWRNFSIVFHWLFQSYVIKSWPAAITLEIQSGEREMLAGKEWIVWKYFLYGYCDNLGLERDGQLGNIVHMSKYAEDAFWPNLVSLLRLSIIFKMGNRQLFQVD